MTAKIAIFHKNFLYNGQKVFEFKIYSCLFNLSYYAIKTVSSIKEHMDLISDNSSHAFFNYYDGCYIVCCKLTVEFTAKSDCNFYSNSSDVSPN